MDLFLLQSEGGCTRAFTVRPGLPPAWGRYEIFPYRKVYVSGEDAGAAAAESFGEDLTKGLDAGSPGHMMMQTDEHVLMMDKSMDATDRDNLESLIKKAQMAPVAAADSSFQLEGHYLPDNVAIDKHAVHTG